MFHLLVLQCQHPLGQSHDLGGPKGQDQTNKPVLTLPPSYSSPSIASLQSHTVPIAYSLNKGMLSLSEHEVEPLLLLGSKVGVKESFLLNHIFI